MGTRYIVRYGAQRNIASFTVKGQAEYRRNATVIVRSNRGVEWGEILCPATEKTQTFLGKSDTAGRILRDASDDDRRKLDELHAQEKREFEGCSQMIAERKLQMQLVDVVRSIVRVVPEPF